MTRKATIVLSALALFACTESERLAGDSGLAPGPGDASASPDTGTPPAPGLDSGVGTEDDAGPGTVTDSGVSTGADSGPAMSASGADPRPGHVGCGDVSCATPEVCCVSLSGQMCQAASSCSGVVPWLCAYMIWTGSPGTKWISIETAMVVTKIVRTAAKRR